MLLTLTLLGDTLVSLYLTTRADRIGRRRMLIVGAALMAAAGLAFAFTHQFWLLVIAGTIGVISPSGHEVGPFLPIEQAALSQVVPDRSTNGRVRLVHARRLARHGARRARGGYCSRDTLQRTWHPSTATARSSWCTRAWRRALRVIPERRLRPSKPHGRRRPPRHGRRSPASPGSTIARRGAETRRRCSRSTRSAAASSSRASRRTGSTCGSASIPQTLGCAVLRGERARRHLGAGRVAPRGPLRPDQHDGRDAPAVERPADPGAADADAAARDADAAACGSASARWTCRRRQSYMMAVVAPDERSAAAGITGVARTTGAALSPLFAGLLFARPSLINVPFFIAGTLKIAYDLLLFRAFRSLKPPEELALYRQRRAPGSRGGHVRVGAGRAAVAARRTTATKIVIDGRLTETAWESAESIEDFRQTDPVEGSAAVIAHARSGAGRPRIRLSSGSCARSRIPARSSASACSGMRSSTPKITSVALV